MVLRPSLYASHLTDSSHPVSLWTRIVSLIVLLLVAGTLITGLTSLFLLQRTLLGTIDSDLNRGIDVLVDVAQKSERPMVAVNKYTSESSYSPVDFIVEFHRENGDLEQRIHRKEARIETPTIELPDLSLAEVKALEKHPFTVSDKNDQRWRVIATELPNAPQPSSVFLAIPLKSLDTNMRTMGMAVLITGSLVVLVGVGIGGYVTHRSLSPLQDMEIAAGHIARGDLGKRVPVTTSSYEVHHLSVSLNEMLVQIEKAFSSQAESEARATRSEAKMRQFVADASHELRTPLAVIRGFGELYRMGALHTDAEVESAIRRIEDEARRMGSLVEDLLRLARLEDNPHLELRPLNVMKTVMDSAQDLRALDPSRQVTICNLAGLPVSGDAEPVIVLADEASLRQVFSNLVGNTFRHTPSGTPVELTVGIQRDGMVAIEVRDHGPGISREERTRIFERFYRTDSSRQRPTGQGGGSGLGLSIATKIVEQHGGRISVHETAGGGAIFRVVLHPAPNGGRENNTSATG
ncbi:sensor histidine kinase [Dermabacteraceae bacterium P13115]